MQYKETKGGKLHVYWHWDKRGKRRRYEVEDEDTFKIFLWMIEKGW